MIHEEPEELDEFMSVVDTDSTYVMLVEMPHPRGFGYQTRMIPKSQLPIGSRWCRREIKKHMLFHGKEFDVYQSPAVIQQIKKEGHPDHDDVDPAVYV